MKAPKVEMGVAEGKEMELAVNVERMSNGPKFSLDLTHERL